jgi:hypothetical protein
MPQQQIINNHQYTVVYHWEDAGFGKKRNEWYGYFNKLTQSGGSSKSLPSFAKEFLKPKFAPVPVPISNPDKQTVHLKENYVVVGKSYYGPVSYTKSKITQIDYQIIKETQKAIEIKILNSLNDFVSKNTFWIPKSWLRTVRSEKFIQPWAVEEFKKKLNLTTL